LLQTKRQKKPNSFYLKNKCLKTGTYFFNKTKEKQKKIAESFLYEEKGRQQTQQKRKIFCQNMDNMNKYPRKTNEKLKYLYDFYKCCCRTLAF